MAKVNYTDEQVRYMRTVYTYALTPEERGIAVDTLAAELKKPKASIISKLVLEKVYIPAHRVSSTTGGVPLTKIELVSKISALIEEHNLEGLEKAPKLVLLRMIKALEKQIRS